MLFHGFPGYRSAYFISSSLLEQLRLYDRIAREEGSMITYEEDGFKFNFRAAAVLIHDGRLLVQTFETEDFWVLPGGRVEMGEATADTVDREMEEELGEKVDVKCLLWVNENFFTLDGVRYHELAHYFLARLTPESTLRDKDEFHREELDGTPMIFRWVPLDKLDELVLYPLSIKERIGSLPMHPEHMVEHN